MNGWTVAGCVGVPPGSLIVGRFGVGCRNLRFSEVFHRRETPDGARGQVVPLLPACEVIDDIFSVHPRCLKVEGREDRQ